AQHRVAVLFHDVTERKRGEEALRESEARFRALAETSPLGVGVSSADGKIIYSNGAYEALLGYDPGELLGRPSTAVYYEPADRQAWLGSTTGTAKVSGWEVRFRRKDGTPVWVEMNACPIEFGGSQAIIGIIQDVTERKQAQAVLARDKKELERLVAERTERLQEIVAELEHFSYTITHDLKSPLRAMRGFAEIASLSCEEGASREAKDALGRISISAERMESLITDALNYSRSVRQELPLTDVDLGTLLRGMLDSYPELQPSKAQIRVEGDLPVVLSNEAGLTQVFSNLLGNAVKFVLRGQKPQIRIWAEAVEDHHQAAWARIWVEDKGIGISDAMLPRVFDMFSRGSKDYEGTGIGLALVRKVTQRMGGRVGVESEEGKGSRFWIELKLGEARAKPARAEPVKGVPRAQTVLYVEDEESDAIFMRRAFAAKGMGSALQVVGDGRAAIEYLSGTEKYADRQEYPLPSLVLLDLNLPQVPGFEVLKWMRNHPDFARTPVVIFSSSTREDDRTKAKELGADEFVAKPS
ncbi:MAG TPA: PAS domain S-box protein, partial [Verrucomicrobiae bacterium]|nr:PAS domain S-box protein [Verrucomicrobiae bacterium]